MTTQGGQYSQRLQELQNVWWKRLLHVQAPYHAHLRRQQLGRTVDVGCGIGRNLRVLGPGSVGVDHNPTSVQVARRAGCTAYTVEEFTEAGLPTASFDGLLFAHVLEHMPAAEGSALVETYLPYLRPGGAAFFICPQERGYASDATHVRFVTDVDLVDLCTRVGLKPGKAHSFPLPRPLGKYFPYNEFCVRATRPSAP